MSAMREAVLRAGTTKAVGGEKRLQGLHRGEIVNVAGAHAYFILPRITGTQVHGPYASLVTGLAAGDRVLVGAIDGRIDDLIVMHIL